MRYKLWGTSYEVQVMQIILLKNLFKLLFCSISSDSVLDYVYTCMYRELSITHSDISQNQLIKETITRHNCFTTMNAVYKCKLREDNIKKDRIKDS